MIQGMDEAILRGWREYVELKQRLEGLCEWWDGLSKGESPTTRQIREAINNTRRENTHGGKTTGDERAGGSAH